MPRGGSVLIPPPHRQPRMGPAEPEKNYFKPVGPIFSVVLFKQIQKKHVESGGGGGGDHIFRKKILTKTEDIGLKPIFFIHYCP